MANAAKAASPYCSDPECVYCRELRLLNELVKTGAGRPSAADMRTRATEMRETTAQMKQSLFDRRAVRDAETARAKERLISHPTQASRAEKQIDVNSEAKPPVQGRI